MNSLKFGFFTDQHMEGGTPRHRVDNYPEALLAKFNETYEVCHREGVDCVLSGGDLFDRHKIFSNSLYNKILAILDKWKIHTYAIVGQHDVEGYNKSTYETSSLSVIAENSPYFHIIWDEQILNEEYKVTACHVWDDPEEFWVREVDDEFMNIAIVHHLLYDSKNMNFEVIDINDVETEFDIVLSGDLHCGYEKQVVNDTLFYNCGSMCRRNISEKKKKPKFAIFNIDENGLDFKEYEYQCAGDGEEVFSKLEFHEINESSEFNSDVYINEMSEIDNDSVDVFDMVKQVGEKNGINPKVLEKIATYRNK